MYNQQYDHQQSFQYMTPNSRIIPAPTTSEYHLSNAVIDTWKQPARTSSLQQHKPQYLDRESLIDPSAGYSYQNHGYARDTYIEPDMSRLVIDSATEDYYLNNTQSHNNNIPSPPSILSPPTTNLSNIHQQQRQKQDQPLSSSSTYHNNNDHHSSTTINHHHNDPEIRTVQPPKSVRSNVQYIVEESPIKVHQAYVEIPQPSVAVYEPQLNFSLQPVPQNKKNNSNANNSTSPYPTSTKSTGSSSSPSSTSSRLPKPPLTPLVIPPTPIRSSSSPNRTLMTPTRTSSIQANSSNNNLHHIQDYQLTPGSTTPGSSRSLNSPAGGLSPFNYSPSTPSPNTLLPHNMLPSPLGTNQYTNMVPSNSTPTNNNSSLKAPKTPLHKKMSFLPDSEAERLVHEGIKFHEAGKLEQATEMFRQSSQMDFPMGMFLYGVSLRHGWGCKKNEHLAFQYLQRSAEHAVEDLNNFSTAVKVSAAKGELVMTIYELGVSFRHGWGCKKSKETAVHYFKIAADLGDPDAQNDLGHCYYHGHGTKKDLVLAAKYYRKADKQGQGIMGNSWIWKSKYDSPSSPSHK